MKKYKNKGKLNNKIKKEIQILREQKNKKRKLYKLLKK